MFSGAGTFVALSQARTLALIILLVALAGFTSELYRPASSALIADLTPPSRRVTAYALYRLAFNAGIAGGGVLAGLAASTSLLAVFIVESVTCAAFGLVALLALRNISPVTSQDGEPVTAPVTSLCANHAFGRFLLAGSLVIIVQLQQSSTLPLHVDERGLSPAVLGLLLTVNGALIVLLELPLSSLTQRLPRRPVIALGALLLGIGMAATGAATTTVALLATVVVWTVGDDLLPSRVGSRRHRTPRPAGPLPGRIRAHLVGRHHPAPVLGTALYARSTVTVWVACASAGAIAAILLLHPSRTHRTPRPCC